MEPFTYLWFEWENRKRKEKLVWTHLKEWMKIHGQDTFKVHIRKTQRKWKTWHKVERLIQLKTENIRAKFLKKKLFFCCYFWLLSNSHYVLAHCKFPFLNPALVCQSGRIFTNTPYLLAFPSIQQNKFAILLRTNKILNV